jgi:hypothetical protein
VRLIIARCSVDYAGRLTAHLPMATRMIMIKADGTVLIHADSGTKVLNWMPLAAGSPSIRFRNLTVLTAARSRQIPKYLGRRVGVAARRTDRAGAGVQIGPTVWPRHHRGSGVADLTPMAWIGQ